MSYIKICFCAVVIWRTRARETSDLNFLNQVRTNCISSHSVETELLGSSTLKSKTLTLNKNFSQSNYGLFGLIFQRVTQRGVSWRKRTQRETVESFEQFCVISIDGLPSFVTKSIKSWLTSQGNQGTEMIKVPRQYWWGTLIISCPTGTWDHVDHGVMSGQSDSCEEALTRTSCEPVTFRANKNTWPLNLWSFEMFCMIFPVNVEVVPGPVATNRSQLTSKILMSYLFITFECHWVFSQYCRRLCGNSIKK